MQRRCLSVTERDTAAAVLVHEVARTRVLGPAITDSVVDQSTLERGLAQPLGLHNQVQGDLAGSPPQVHSGVGSALRPGTCGAPLRSSPVDFLTARLSDPT
jgi:hypothetical protein